MNTPTAAPTATPTAEQQGTHHYLITLQVPVHAGFSTATRAGTCTPPAEFTRHDVYQWLRNDIEKRDRRFADASLLFFDLQPNRL